MKPSKLADFQFDTATESPMHARFMPHIFAFADNLTRGMRALEVGCGNGFLCGEFLKRGCQIVGIDSSVQGIELARKTYPTGRFELLAAGAEILTQLCEEPFDLVISTEVVEHLYAPREWAEGCFKALKPGGHFICTTPYHGYLKNLVISLLGKWDTHANPLWDGGHIKLWSKKSLLALLTEVGFTNVQFRGAGRMPGLWMTMIAKADKPL